MSGAASAKAPAAKAAQAGAPTNGAARRLATAMQWRMPKVIGSARSRYRSPRHQQRRAGDQREAARERAPRAARGDGRARARRRPAQETRSPRHAKRRASPAKTARRRKRSRNRRGPRSDGRRPSRRAKPRARRRSPRCARASSTPPSAPSSRIAPAQFVRGPYSGLRGRSGRSPAGDRARPRAFMTLVPTLSAEPRLRRRAKTTETTYPRPTRTPLSVMAGFGHPRAANRLRYRGIFAARKPPPHLRTFWWS